MNSKAEIARRERRRHLIRTHYRWDVRELIDIYSQHEAAGDINEELIDALRNCLDVSGGPAWP